MKKNKSILSKLICGIIALSVVLSIGFLTNINVKAESYLPESTVQCNFDADSENNEYADLETSKDHFTIDEKISLSYNMITDAVLRDVRYSQNGFTAIEVDYDSNNANRVDIEFSSVPNSTEYYISFEFELSTGDILRTKIYAVRTAYGVFISSASEDDARERFFVYAVDAGIMTLQEYDRITSNLSKRCIVPMTDAQKAAMCNIDPNTIISESDLNSPNASIQSTQITTIQGFLAWWDNYDNPHNLQYVKVEIYYNPSGILPIKQATVYTDVNGHFTYTSNTSLNDDYIYFRVYAGDDNVSVKKNSILDAQYYIEDNSTFISDSQLYFTCSFDMSTDAGKALQIGQATLNAREYAEAMMGEEPDDVTVIYPTNDDGCNYNDFLKTIRITGKEELIEGDLYSYESWDVIMHEYGHHIQYQLDIINSPGGKHNAGDNLIDTYGKDAGIRLAWAEAWPTVFGMAAQNYYNTYLQNIVGVNNGCYDAYNFELPYPIENNYYYKGEGSEDAIMAVLYDLLDNTTETADTIYLSHIQFWNVTTGNQSKTFSDFIQYFYTCYPQFKDDIGANLSKYGMASSAPSISNLSSLSETVKPSITWNAQGGSTECPNNCFSLVIYDSAGYEILRKNNLTYPSYILTQAEWDLVRNSEGTTYTIAVAVSQTSSPVTGEYYSTFVSYSKPVPVNMSEYISLPSDHRYTEKVVTLSTANYIDYHITTTRSGYRIFQTFGNKNTQMELYSSNGTLLASDLSSEQSGIGVNSMICYYLSANTQYVLRVRLGQFETTGEIKFTVTPAHGLLEDPTDTLGAFEDLKYIIFEDNYNFNVTFEPNQTQVFVYVPPENGSYTISTTGNKDTYIYLIDPLSTNEITSSNYNDNGGTNNNASLTATLQGQKIYFVIVSLKDPSSITSNTTVNVSIVQN